MKHFAAGSFLFLFLFFPSTTHAQVVINEFVPDANPEWVELYNASASAEFLKSYYLDDDASFDSDTGSSTKKLLTNLDISNPSNPFVEIASFLNNSGDSVVLFDDSGFLVDQYQYTSNPGDGVSIGRNPDGSGDFTILLSATKGSTNSSPAPSPSPTPQPTPTKSPTPTPTKSPTPTPAKAPSPTPKVTQKAAATSTPSEVESQISQGTGETSVLGLRNEPSSPSPTPLVKEDRKNFPIIPVLLIAAGVGCLGFAGFMLIKKAKTNYNNERDAIDEKVT